eukprot:2894569-Pyramimonas_sp.AAC.1
MHGGGIGRIPLGSGAPGWPATGVPGVLDHFGFGCGSLPKDHPWGFGPPRRPPETAQDGFQNRPDGPRWRPSSPKM